MRRISVIFLFVAVAVFFSGCRCWEKTPELTVIEFASSRDSNYDFGGRTYLVLLCKQGENYFLQSHIPDYTEKSRTVFSHNLGKNVLIASNGLKFKDGQMTVEYRDSNENWQEAGVPFGDFYGDKHVSQVKFIKYLAHEPTSDKYRPAGVSKSDEPAIESILPTLQKHIRNNDADAISKMLIYPVETESVRIETRHDFLKYYPQIFSENVKKDLLKLQNEDILCTSEGLRINYGNGIWFSPGGDGEAYFHAIRL